MVYLTSLLNPTSSYVLPQPLPVTTTNAVTSLSAYVTNPQIEVTNDIGNPIPTTVTTAVTTIPTGIQNVTYASSPQLDLTGRLRTAQLGSQWWYNPSIDKDGDYRMIESFVSTATSVFIQNYASTVMTSGLNSTGSGIRTSRRRHKMRPGVSMLWEGTFNWDGLDPNVVKRKGWFTNYNGAFFELSGGDINCVIRQRLPDGTLNEARIPRSQWNGDKLDGTGTSGENWNVPALSAYTTNTITPTVTAVVINPITGNTVWNVQYSVTNAAQASAFGIGTKVTVNGLTPSSLNGPAVVKAYTTSPPTITLTYLLSAGAYASGISTASIVQSYFHTANTYWFDLLGNRTNQVRMGKISNNGLTVLHTFNFNNTFGSPFFNAPAMPIRVEIFNTGSVNYQPTLSLFGSNLNIEAGVDLNPYFASVYNNTGISVNASSTPSQEVVILGVGQRFGEPYQRGDIQVQSFGIQDLNNAPGKNANNSIIFWRLLFNPGLSGLPTSVNTGKSIQYWPCTSTTGLTGSTPSGYAIAGGGWELLSGYAQSGDTINVNTQLNFLNLGSNISYTDADKIFLTARVVAPGGNTTSNLVANMNVIESL